MSLLTPQRPGDGAHTHSAETLVPDQSRAERTASFDVADFARPGGREEEWRFTPVDRLAPLLANEDGAAPATVTFTLPDGVESDTLAAEAARALPAPQDRAAAVAAARSAGARRVRVAEGIEAGPIHVSIAGSPGPTFAHLVVEVGANATASVVIEHSGAGDYSELVTVVAGDGAHVEVVSLQLWEDDARHLGQHDVVVGRDATVNHIVATLGGGIVRLNTNAHYAQPGGSFEGLGVYFADESQHLEHRLFVDHEAPNCRSNVEYKGALQGEGARTVWVGDVLIRASASGTDTYELNRNLLLTDGARADSVPNLEIETGEIAGAGHASATGRFDDAQLFYLMARGIPADEARRLVVRGFFASIIARIGNEDVAARLMTAIEAELEGVGA